MGGDGRGICVKVESVYVQPWRREEEEERKPDY